MHKTRKLLLFLAALFGASLLLPLGANGQTVTGGESVVTPTSGTANIASSIPATNFNTPNGVNTFIISSIPSNSAIRLQIANVSANACNGSLQVTFWTTMERQVSSFNNNLSVWQLAPVINPTTGVYSANTGTLNLLASSSTLLTTAAIAGNQVAIQIVNTTGQCSTTNLDVVAVFVPTAITSSLVTVASNGAITASGGVSNVQGVVPPLSNGSTVNPIVNGGLQLPVNSAFASVGIDNFSIGSVSEPSGFLGTTPAIAVAPNPKAAGEFAVAFDIPLADNQGGFPQLVTPWVCGPNFSVVCTSSNLSVSSTSNIVGGTSFRRAFNLSSGSSQPGQNMAAIVEISPASGTIPTVRQANNGGASGVYTSNTLAGSLLLAAVTCVAAPCTTSAVTDTQGNAWQQIETVTNSGGLRWAGLIVYASTTLSTAAADTVTFTASGGTVITQSAVVEVTGQTPSGLTSLLAPIQVDTTGAQVVRLDAQSPNQFNCTVTLTTNTTTQCQPAATTISGIPVRYYVTDFQINTTTAGTATVITLKTGTGSNCGTNTANLSAITYANATVALTSVLGTRTPLVSPLQSAVCAQQSGTTPGTSVIEIRGYSAP